MTSNNASETIDLTFKETIARDITSCWQAGYKPDDHFGRVRKMIRLSERVRNRPDTDHFAHARKMIPLEISDCHPHPN